MGTILVKGVAIGEGRPKICVPLVGANAAELEAEAVAARFRKADLVELRIDFFRDIREPDRVLDAVRAVAGALDGIPLLFTFRSKREGGRAEIDPSHYAELNAAACESGCVDLLDVELFTAESARSAAIGAARARKVAVVVSSHDFDKTPSVAEMTGRLSEAARLGDIAKLAVMPRSIDDVLSLLAAGVEAGRRAPDTPMITMSMGALGAVSRLAGEAFGSAVTFGTAGKASAPGQIPVEKLSAALEIIHEAMRSDR